MTGSDSETQPQDRSATSGGGLAALEKAAREAGSRGAPPVEKWNPDYCGDLDIRIARDGSWHYLGTPIGRQRLVRLFASVLRKDGDGRTYLVTPVEKIGIAVDDAPFLAVEMAVEGEARGRSVSFRTNVDDVVTAGPDHPLRFEEDAETGGVKPYVLVRGRLEALVTRALLYDLVELAEEAEAGGESRLGVWSGGVFFPMPHGSGQTAG